MAASFDELSKKLGFLKELHADNSQGATRLEAAQARASRAAKKIRLHIELSSRNEAYPPRPQASAQP